MPWIMLITAGLFETGFAFCLGKAQKSNGQESMLWYAGFAFFLILSMILLMKSVNDIPIGTAYAVWTGIGAAGAVITGIYLLDEPAGFWRIFFLVTLIISIVGLKFFSK